MKRHGILAAVLACAVTMGLSGCLDDLTEPPHDNPLDPSSPSASYDEPPKPTSLAAVVADRSVELSWSVSDPTDVEGYRVYRWEVEEDGQEEHELLDEAEATEYTDADVRNGQGYSYRVSAVNPAGLEGKLSSAVTATPSVFSVIIDGGRERTGSRNVALSLSAPGGTALMQISNAADMGDAQWEPYRASASWMLEAGDGAKASYARFRDASDNESNIVSDDIELDTRAVIESITEDTGGATMVVDDGIHFTLTSGETSGTAYVDIGDQVTDLELYDDGTGGDATADDGVYERDYTVENGVEAFQAFVTGYFQDEVGNDAQPVVASGTVTITDLPSPVTLGDPIPLSKRALALSWTRNNDSDFASYKVYRSYVPGVETSGEIELLAEITSAPQTDYTDTGLEPDSTYYYAVYVLDDIGHSVVSNEVAGTTMANEPPAPVELYQPWAADTTTIEVSWSQSDEDDFMQYELIGWEQIPPNPPDSAGKRLLVRIDVPTDTFYTHESLVGGTLYWYQVAVVDSFGASALSDSMAGTPRPTVK